MDKNFYKTNEYFLELMIKINLFFQLKQLVDKMILNLIIS